MNKQIQPDSDPRLEAGRQWALKSLSLTDTSTKAIVADASFRRYFRLQDDNRSWVLMDAPPAREDLTGFVDVNARLRAAGLHAPEILHRDVAAGYLLLEDLGDDLYRDLIKPETVDDVWPELFNAVEVMATLVDHQGLPDYDAGRLQEELDLLPDWYLAQHKNRPLNQQEQEIWRHLCATLIECARQQPIVFVHRDFHSCNLLKTQSNSPGIIDFQDAVAGPLCYDFISLLWDRYISWPRPQVEHWMEQMRRRLAPELESETWVRWCDWLGLQRNIKVVGIFARLFYRDSKLGYLEMIPRFYDYMLDTLARYPQFQEFNNIMREPRCVP